MTLSTHDRILSNIRTKLNTFLSDTCTIRRKLKSYDPAGAPTGAGEIVEADVSCRVIEGKGDLDDIGNQQILTEWYRLIVPVGTELNAGYSIELSDGTIFQIIDMIARRTEAMDVQAIMKREVR